MEEKAFEETKIPVMLLKNKTKDEHFLASGVDFIVEGDPDGDVTLKHVENAFAIVRNDFRAPTNEDLESKSDVFSTQKNMIDKFGEYAVVLYDVEKWLKSYVPINVEITLEQYNKLAENDVEPVFGFLKANLRFTRLSVRGNSKVDNEIGLALMAVNLRKFAVSSQGYIEENRKKVKWNRSISLFSVFEASYVPASLYHWSIRTNGI